MRTFSIGASIFAAAVYAALATGANDPLTFSLCTSASFGFAWLAAAHIAEAINQKKK